ncbi:MULTISPECIES: type IV secretion system protein VirB3 [Vibrionaceae]|uniref:type IV secretion system protein VirB3 n=1 Tax=Vibrionaceae TaxID=641 RepID=UPI0006C03A78|nr:MULTISPECIES: VirB3 family type IV secretion system protein [Vibrio]EID0160592.1 VirB3 family type IV secretion system protein [Vibrio cholerae]EJG1067223.1 VirB3 family type IV secretion system protein [Vibrio parahaemolyticus O1]HDM8230321.1 VirB3 family type IV secretion system protein [Vibrio campbellii]EGR2205549.1 conjugal transfer protein [Vibrio parahaemolyticus]EHY1001213.1 VirB3 family type IV secretion system protein [Vibrio parahaemolyticus]
MASGIDPLFVAATRPAMKWGVTLDGIIIGGGLVGIAMIGTGNPFTLLLYLPIHGVMYLLCLRDPRTFRLILLWVGTKMKSLGWRHWGASTATPLVNTRGVRRMPK